MIRLIILCLLSLLSYRTSALQCIAPGGNVVDWYAMYKLPILEKESLPILKKGLGVFYLDVGNSDWTLSTEPVNDTSQALYRTLAPIYNHQLGIQDEEMMYLMYNDQPPPNLDNLSHGHTKGVVAFNRESGFWLVHSTPHFPAAVKTGFLWPSTGCEFGQSFLCISFSYNQLKNISKQLLFNYPKIYDHNVPEAFLSDIPDLNKLLQNSYNVTAPWQNELILHSLGGVSFYSFAKYKNFNADLYSAFVAPALGSSLLVETWRNGPGDLNSSCIGPFKVMNIQEISLPEEVLFDTNKDHSKWAVSYPHGPWICIGDINRQTHQLKRAGGTVCWKNQAVWESYNRSVSEYEKCPPSLKVEL